MIKKILFFLTFIFFILTFQTFAEDLKKVGKFKDWEVMIMSEASNKVCFAQSVPVLQAPKKDKRDGEDKNFVTPIHARVGIASIRPRTFHFNAIKR